MIGHASIDARSARGFALVIALIVLVALSLAGVAMMRSVTSGTLLAGNVNFKIGATAAADFGVEQARAWLRNARDLEADQRGYMGLVQYNAGTGIWTPFDPAAFSWESSGSSEIDAGNGYRVRYVIQRMCSVVGGGPITRQCVLRSADGSGSSRADTNYADLSMTGGTAPYYRVSVRVQGVKGTTSYVQTMVY